MHFGNGLGAIGHGGDGLRQSPEGLRNLPITAPDGRAWPAGALADIGNRAVDASNELKSKVEGAKTNLYGINASVADPAAMAAQATGSAASIVAPQGQALFHWQQTGVDPDAKLGALDAFREQAGAALAPRRWAMAPAPNERAASETPSPPTPRIATRSDGCRRRSVRASQSAVTNAPTDQHASPIP